MFRRGPDDIPRGSITLLYKTVLHDKRANLYSNLSKLCDTPKGALAFAEAAGDRIEGRPTQRHEVAPARETFFGAAPVDVTPAPTAMGPGSAKASIAPPAGEREVALTGTNGERLRPV